MPEPFRLQPSVRRASFVCSLLISFFIGLGAAAPVHAAWLQICPGWHPDARQNPVRITSAAGAPLTAFISHSATQDPCERFAIDLPADGVTGLHFISAKLAASLGSRFSLSARREGQQVVISDIAPDTPSRAERPTPFPLPLGSNLLLSLRASVFGAESRAEVSLKDGQLHLQCRAGSQPAGIRLDSGAYLPLARIQLQMSGSGSGTFEILAANATQAGSGAASHLGNLQARTQPELHSWKWSPAGDPAGWRHWTIACPQGAGNLRLHNLQLVPQERALPSRSTWVWQADEWQQTPDRVLMSARQYGLGSLFITIPQDAGSVRHPARLAAFIRRAHASGLAVWGVDGDPAMVLPEERQATLARARAYARFNRSMPPEARLTGVQFDVEPYLLPGRELSDAQSDQQYLALIQALHRTLQASASHRNPELALEMVVPFWWAGRTALLTALAPSLRGLVVMNYRTSQEDIYRLAVPFLDWGERHGKSVRIALEAGPIAPETRQRYELAEAGEMWQVHEGGRHFLLTLDQPLKNPGGATFRLANTYILDGSATTFRGDIPALLRQLPLLEQTFSAWPSFIGMALHEIP